MLQNLSSAAVVIGALRVNKINKLKSSLIIVIAKDMQYFVWHVAEPVI